MSKILQLKAENFLNLSVVEIVPDGTAVWLKGKNEAGKSAVMDAVFAALTGKRPENCIKEGEDEANIEVVMDGYTVRRKIVRVGKKDQIKLEVVNNEGMRIASPQTFLDGLIGKLTFDPMEFAREHPLDQKRIVLAAVGVDFSDLENEKKTYEDNRRDKGRDLKKIEGALATMKKPPKDFDGGLVSIQSMIDRVNSLRKAKAAFESDMKDRAEAERRRDEALADIEEHKAEIARLEKIVEDWTAVARREVSPCPPQTEIDDAEKALSGAELRNNEAADFKKYLDLEADKKIIKDDLNQIESQIASVETERARRLKEATMPIEGLGFDDEGLTYNGLPLARQSAGRSCEIYTAIAMALNPNLRTIFIRDASLLDSDMLGGILGLATEKDYQVWLEKVEEKESGKYPEIGIYLESGGVVAIDGSPVEVK